MANKLSNSSINKFSFCGEAYRLHYVERYRPTQMSSALFFGSAIDKTIETILKKEQGELTDTEVFDYNWRYQFINNVRTHLPDSNDIIYSKKDFDRELLTQADLDEANGNEQYLNWLSLRAKGHLMVQAFNRDILPRISKVVSTQEFVELANDEGDTSIGYCDAVIEMDEYDAPIILDWKTAANPYADDSVRYSAQLSQYLHTLGPKYGNTRLAGYVVFLKNISKNRTKKCSVCAFDGSGAKFKTCNNEVSGKRCGGEWIEVINPRCETQMIIDTIPEKFENMVIDNIAAVNSAISNNIFPKNLRGCKDNGFGRECEYFNICYSGDTTGFIKKEETTDAKSNENQKTA